MWLQVTFFFCATLAVNARHVKQEELDRPDVKHLNETIYALIEHFKQPDPVGLPGLPDVYYVPEMNYTIFLDTVFIKNTVVYGINKFRILNAYVKFPANKNKVEIEASISIDALQIRGNYNIKSLWLSPVQEHFTVYGTDLKMTTRATIGVEQDGKLKTQNMTTTVEYSTITTNFESSNLVVETVKSMYFPQGSDFFNSIEPYILEEANTKFKTYVNTILGNLAGDFRFPTTISPLDALINTARDTVRNSNLDPYPIESSQLIILTVPLTLYNTQITGLSSFYRVGDVTIKLENNIGMIDCELRVDNIKGSTGWQYSLLGGLYCSYGTASLTTNYISSKVILGQPLDTRKKPFLEYIHVDIGRIHYEINSRKIWKIAKEIIECVVDEYAQELSRQIMHSVNNVSEEEMQQELDKIDVERIINTELVPKLVEMLGADQ